MRVVDRSVSSQATDAHPHCGTCFDGKRFHKPAGSQAPFFFPSLSFASSPTDARDIFRDIHGARLGSTLCGEGATVRTAARAGST